MSDSRSQDQPSQEPASSTPSPTTVTDAVETRPPLAASAANGETDLRSSTRRWLIQTLVRAASVVLAAILILFSIGVAQRMGWIKSGGDGADASTNSSGGHHSAKRYICPMMCTPPLSEPGRCPVCGMELVEATSGQRSDPYSVMVPTAARRLVGIQTAVSRSSAVMRTIRTIGSIDFDESRLSTISAYVDGRLEQMYADYVGVSVSEGDDIALLYSPRLYSAQTEFVTSLENGPPDRFSIDSSDLTAMATENLRELGMSEAQIERLRQTKKPESRIRIQSPQSGTVIAKQAVEGDYVKTGQKLYEIADLSSVWLMLDLFPDDAAAVRFGQEVEAEVQSVQGEIFTGRVSFIDPTVDAESRTVRVRVEVLNFDGKLKPGDFATAEIRVPAVPVDRVYDPALANKYISPMHPQVIRDTAGPCPLCGMDLIPTSDLGFSPVPLPEQRVVTVPRNSVLIAGNESVLYVETEPGRFEIRRITIGAMTKTEAVVLSGLDAGETVATDGNFLIDSQMQLAGNPSILDPSRAPSFAEGPLELPATVPLVLDGEAGQLIDRVYQIYFEIQQTLAADTVPPPVLVYGLSDGLAHLEQVDGIPDEARVQFGSARRAAAGLNSSLDTARSAFRTVSRAMLRASVITRGPESAGALTQFHCSMVPGRGGDWMQADRELLNPYWGSEMLRCGVTVRDLSVPTEEPSPPTPPLGGAL